MPDKAEYVSPELPNMVIALWVHAAPRIVALEVAGTKVSGARDLVFPLALNFARCRCPVASCVAN